MTTDTFSNGNWQTNWVIDSAAGNLTPTAYTESGKSDLILFTVPSGATAGKSGTCKIMTRGGDALGYGTYEARFKVINSNCRGANAGVYVGMGLWNFYGSTQQEVMMGFYNESPTNDDFQILTTKNRPRDGSEDPTNIYHSKIVGAGVTFASFESWRTIKFVYSAGQVLGYLDGTLVLTKTDLVPSESMALVIGCRVTGTGSLSADLKVVFDYVTYPGTTAAPASTAQNCIAWLGDARPSKFGSVGITELTEDLNKAYDLSPTGSLDAIVLVGDFDTQKQTQQAISASKCKNIPIIWVVGNHEIDSSGIAGIRDRYALIPSSLNRLPGPTGTEKTTYSVDVGKMHVVNINSYWDGGTNDGSLSIGGYIHSKLQTWINSNLSATTKPWKIAATHEPLYPYKRHVGDSLDANKTNRDILQASFVSRGVQIVFAAHTHYSAIHVIGGIYHVDAGVSGHKTADGEDTKASIFYTYTSGNTLILKWIQEPWSSPVTKATYTLTGTSTLPDMTPSELAAYDGKNGHSAYVAVNNIVYNVSSASSWSTGTHKGIHAAGQDLTDDFLGKHALSYITSFPQVANLISEPSPSTIEKWHCSGSPNYVCTRDDTLTKDYYLSEELCKAACKLRMQGNGWDMGIPQATGEWFKLNMGGLVPVKKLFINNSNSYPDAYPRNFQITASADNVNYDEILTMTGNESVDLIVDFPGNLYQYIKIVLTGSDPSGNSWAIGEMSVYSERPILAKWTDEDSVIEHGLYEDVIKDPNIISKSQAFARAVEEVSARKDPPISAPLPTLRYFFDCSPNELVTIEVPGTGISEKMIIEKVQYSESAKGTFQESIEVRSVN